MSIVRSGRINSFLPSMSSLHFSNVGAPPLPIKIPIIGTVSGNFFNNGLCTGFVFTVLDFFTASPRILIVSNTAQPTWPLLSYVEQRWIDGQGPQDWTKALWYAWAPTHNTVFGSVLSWLGISIAQGTSWSVVNNELPAVMQDIDRGMPSPITLVTGNIGDEHCILIWSYLLDSSGEVTLLAYDPNEPNNDDVQITFNISNPDQTISFNWGTVSTSAQGNPDWRAFFRASYVGDLLGATTIGLAGDPVASLGQLQPLAPPWNAWQSLGLPPDSLSLESPYSSGYVPGSQPLDPLGTAPATSPAVCSWGPNRLDVFIQDNQGGADHLSIGMPAVPPLFGVAEPVFTWESLNQILLSYPAAASWGEGRLDVFGVLGGLNYSMAHIAFENDGWASGWESLGLAGGNWDGTPIPLDGSAGSAEALEFMQGRPFLSRPCACSWSPGHLDLIAVSGGRDSGDGGQIANTDGNIYHTTFDGGNWAPWYQVPRTFTILPGSSPAVCTWGVGRLDLFIIAAGAGGRTPGSLRHLSYTTDAAGNGSWASAWEDLGSPPAGLGTQSQTQPSPAACTWGNDRLDVFAVGGDGQLWHIWFDGQWHPWEDIGGKIQSDPCCVSWGSNRIDVLASATDFALWHIWFQG